MVDLRNNPGALQGLLTRVLLQRVGADALARSGLLVNAIGFALVACLVFVPRIEYLLARLRVCSDPFLRRSPIATGRPAKSFALTWSCACGRKTINSAPAD